MEWREPHPRRIATPDEVQENKQQIKALDEQIKPLDGQIKQMTRRAEESARKLLQLQQEQTNLLSLIDLYGRSPIKILRKIALRRVKSKIQTVNDPINETLSMTEELTRKLLQLQQDRASRLSFIATYRRLPTEILGEIAWHCFQIGIKPSVLNQVDAAMRYAVNGFKALWARIYVSYSSSPTETVRGSSHYLQKLKGSTYIVCRNPIYLQLALDRASPSPLSIAINSLMLVTAFEVLAPFSIYVKTLEITGMFVSEIPQFPRLDFRALQYLCVDDHSYEYGRKDFIVHLLATAQISDLPPMAFNLRLTPAVFSTLMHYPAFRNAHQLTINFRSTLNCPIPTVALPFLRSFSILNLPFSLDGAILPALLYLNIAGHSTSRIDIDDIPSQIRVLNLGWCILHQRSASSRYFPDLHDCCLRDISRWNLMPGSITAPMLKTFDLVYKTTTNDYNVTPEPITFWLNGLPLRSPLLKHLTLGHTVLALDIASQMHQFRSLQTLTFNKCTINKGVIALLLTPSEQTAFFLPSLHTLTFYKSVAMEGWSFNELQERCKVARPSLEVIVDRYGLNPRLQKIYADDCGPFRDWTSY